MPAATERPVQDPNEFLMGGGIPSASFPEIGAAVKGTVCDPAPFLQQQRDYTTGEPKTWDDGNAMMQLVVTLQTDERSAEIEEDDGRRRIYLKNNMKKAVAEAVRLSKAKGVEVGGQLTVAYTADGEPSKKGMQKPKLYIATYVPPGTAFLNNGQHEESEAGTDWAWSDGVRYAVARGVTEAVLKAEFKKAGITKWDKVTSPKFVIELCAMVNKPLADDDIPF